MYNHKIGSVTVQLDGTHTQVTTQNIYQRYHEYYSFKLKTGSLNTQVLSNSSLL